MAKEAINVDNIADWGIDEYAKYFEGSKRLFGNSKLFEAVKAQIVTIRNLQDAPVDERSAMEMIGAGDKLMKACVSYMDERKGASSEQGKERLEVVHHLLNFYTKHQVEKNYDQLRDLRTVRSYAGKTWKEMETVPTATAEVTGKMEKVGANASQRIKVEYQGKKGFFTASETVMSAEESVDRQLEGEQNPQRKQLLESNAAFLKENTDVAGKTKVTQEDYRRLDLLKQLDEMEPSFQKENFRQLLIHGGGIGALNGTINGYQKGLQALSEAERNDPQRKKEVFENHINGLSGVEESVKRKLFNNRELICSYAENEPAREMVVGGRAERVMMERMLYEDMALHNTERDKAVYEARKALLHDEAAKTQGLSIMKKAKAADLAAGDSAQLKIGDELSGRNVATSRIAELLGLGSLVAHSEKMTVKVGDKELHGCFMEFAEGVDVRNGNDMDQRLVSQIDFGNSPGFTKDACNLEVLDYICAQGDRHAGNMFLKLGELGPDGTRQVVGIQGIDNDFAFSTRSLTSENFALKQGVLGDLCFISEDVAQRVCQLDRDKLEYAVGDILSKEEIDALAGRVQKMQENIRKNMITVKDDEWNLDKYDASADPATLDETGKRYVQGLKDLDAGLTAKFPWDMKHKNSHVAREIRGAQERYQKAQEAETDILSGVQDMFAEAEKSVQMESAKIQEERARRFDEILKQSGGGKGAPQAPIKEKATERMSLNDLEEKKDMSAQRNARMSFRDMKKSEQMQQEKAAEEKKLQIGVRKFGK